MKSRNEDGTLIRRERRVYRCNRCPLLCELSMRGEPKGNIACMNRSPHFVEIDEDDLESDKYD